MNSRFGWKSILFVTALALTFGALSVFAGQNQAAPSGKPQIQTVPPQATNPASGKEMYMAYCASCHGANGTGNGPAASALKVPPANLTTLAKNNGGKFPDAKVAQSIKGDPDMPSAHGSQQMPVWGPTFWQLGHNEAQVQQRVRNLTSYVASLQQK